MVCFMICPWIFNGLDFNLCLTVWHFDVCFYILIYIYMSDAFWLFLITPDNFWELLYFNHFWYFDNSDISQHISGQVLQMRHISETHWARSRWSRLGPRQKLGAFVENALEVPKCVDLHRAAIHFKEKRWILWKGSITCCCDPWISFSSLGCMIEL